MKIAVVIVTLNESKHIGRCLESLRLITDDIYIVDAGSKDDTVEIAQRFGAKVFTQPWISYAKQFQWALDNCGITAPWVMRMDADEYLEPELVKEINEAIIPDKVNGIYIRRKVLFKGKWIRYGGFYPHTLLRIWRNGIGSIEQRRMDEHIVISSGDTLLFKEHLVDYNLNSIHWWVNKHNNYAINEMVDLLNIKYGFIENDSRLLQSKGSQAKRKRFLKEKVYASIPLGTRAFMYFIYRYVLRFGFMDGYQGFVFHFMQGYWYRLLVDVNVREFEVKLAGDKRREKVVELLKQDYNVAL